MFDCMGQGGVLMGKKAREVMMCLVTFSLIQRIGPWAAYHSLLHTSSPRY